MPAFMNTVKMFVLPTMPARPNVVTMVVNAGFGDAIPNARIPDNPAVYMNASCNPNKLRLNV